MTTSRNDITRDKLITKSATDDYRDGWDRIFSSRKKEEVVPTPTLEQKVEVYERLLHRLQLNGVVTMDEAMVQQLLYSIYDWSYAHRAGNGELSDDELQRQIDIKFWNLSK